MAVAGLLLAALVAMLAIGLAGGDGPLPDEVRITDVPDAYRIVYEVRAAAGPDQPETVTTEIVQVERPFRSLVAVRSGSPPGDELVSGRITELNRLQLYGDGGWTEVQIPPAAAASDVRLDGVLQDLVETGDVERLVEVRRIAGRACQVHRLGGPIGGGDLPAVGSSEDEHADICVDETGLVLWEEWVADGDVLRVRTAVDVDVEPDFAEDTFTVEAAEVVPATDGGGSAQRVADDTPFGDRTWELPAPPAGFEHVGRFAIVRPRLDTAIDPLAPPTEGRIAGIATVWVDGSDALVVEQGGTAGGGRPFAAHPNGERIDLGALDLGEVFTDARGTEVRVSYTDGTFVRVWSTLPRDQVIDLARSLEPR